MDTGASSHLNSNVNNLRTVFNSCLYLSIRVGDGKTIPVTNTGHSILPTLQRPLHLHNVLLTPNIIKNLISVCQFTRDNNCTIEFDAFGFSVKDFLTRHILLKCDSSGDLYPVTKPSSLPSALMSLSPSTWHQRLGHPGNDVLRSLSSCNKEKSPHVCHACQLGKHVKLPFSSSTSIVSSCFEIIHSDIWTTPIVLCILSENILSWSSKRQPTLSRSSVEAEYRGVANVVAKMAWLRNLLRELHTPLLTATLMYCDNVSAVDLSVDLVQHQRTKHVEIGIHFIRDMVAMGHVQVHVSSRYQYANIFTKGLPSALFEEFRTSLSVRLPSAQTAREC
ncbi:ribonuclease H-like domain-containing protein [Tanacetum coccineum]